MKLNTHAVKLPVPSWKKEIRPKEAAEYIGVSVAYIYRLMGEGDESFEQS